MRLGHVQAEIKLRLATRIRNLWVQMFFSTGGSVGLVKELIDSPEWPGVARGYFLKYLRPNIPAACYAKYG